MSNIIDYWEQEGFLFSVPDDLKNAVVTVLEEKATNVRNGKDFKDQPEDYDQLVISYLDSVEFWKENKELLDED